MEQTRKIAAQKEELISVAIVEKVIKTGLAEGVINLQEEAIRRFPRIMSQRLFDGSEHWYWNDGSKEGLHLISFYQTEPKYNFLDGTFTGEIGIKYSFDAPAHDLQDNLFFNDPHL